MIILLSYDFLQKQAFIKIYTQLGIKIYISFTKIIAVLKDQFFYLFLWKNITLDNFIDKWNIKLNKILFRTMEYYCLNSINVSL